MRCHSFSLDSIDAARVAVAVFRSRSAMRIAATRMPRASQIQALRCCSLGFFVAENSTDAPSAGTGANRARTNKSLVASSIASLFADAFRSVVIAYAMSHAYV